MFINRTRTTNPLKNFCVVFNCENRCMVCGGGGFLQNGLAFAKSDLSIDYINSFALLPLCRDPDGGITEVPVQTTPRHRHHHGESSSNKVSQACIVSCRLVGGV